ncbi:unnamed protein product [Closterium sp. NIES-64]|nr:unnamed protein product [Closterium sp. NIES-64]CAI5977407.1 unnamed protein product [Closterium sp. NIES-65]
MTAARIVTTRPLTVHLVSGRLPARRLGVGPQLRVRPLLQSANGSTPLVAGTISLAASISRAHLARSRLCARAQVGVRVVGDGEVTVAAEKRVQRRPQWSADFWIGLMTWRRSFVARVRGRRHHQLLALLPSSLSPRSCPIIPLDPPARSLRLLPAGMGFVGAGGGPPWAQFAPPRPLPARRDLAMSSHRARASALLPPMKEVPTATLARLWSLAASLQSLERILQESFDSMPHRVLVQPLIFSTRFYKVAPDWSGISDISRRHPAPSALVFLPITRRVPRRFSSTPSLPTALPSRVLVARA